MTDRQYGFYGSEENLVSEIKKFLSVRRGSEGASERAILKVINEKPWIKCKDEFASIPNATKGDRLLGRDFRTGAIVPAVKRLHDDGFKVCEIADALEIPYSTAWYHVNKLRKHIRTKNYAAKRAWKLDETKKHFVAISNKRPKSAIEAEKLIKQKALEKRERKLKRRAAMAAK